MEKFQDCDFEFLTTSNVSLLGQDLLHDCCNFEMSTADRTRKYSISDIIDVLNFHEEKIHIPKSTDKEDGYDSGNAESICSPSSNKSFNSNNEAYESIASSKGGSKHTVGETDIAAEKDSKISKNTFPSYSNVDSSKLKRNDLPLNESLAASINNAHQLLNTNTDAVIIVFDKNKNIQYVSTSRKKLENYLQAEILKNEESHGVTIDSANVQEIVQKTENNQTECSTHKQTEHLKHDQTEDLQHTSSKSKRGRKRVYTQFNNEKERQELKRERNNQACQKFRKTKTDKAKTLYDLESKLLQKNLNLKEEVSALSRQLELMKEKLGMKS